MHGNNGTLSCIVRAQRVVIKLKANIKFIWIGNQKHDVKPPLKLIIFQNKKKIKKNLFLYKACMKASIYKI